MRKRCGPAFGLAVLLAVPLGLSPVAGADDIQGSASRSSCTTDWHRVPVTIAADRGYLLDVDALSATQAWAVGYAWDTAGSRASAPAEPWLRSSEPSGDPTSQGDLSTRAAGRDRALILQWDGVSWTEMLSPGIDARWFSFDAISVLSPTDAWIVGDQWMGYSGTALIEHFDGVAWSLVTPPDIGADYSLSDVYAVSATDVWAVGGWDDRRQQRGFLLHFDGTDWSVVDGPRTWSGWFAAVDGSGGSDVWTTGMANRISGNQGLYAQHFDGATWTRTKTGGHDTGGEGTGLEVFSPSDAWLVGYAWGWRNSRPIAQYWDGVTWANRPVPNVGEQGSVLMGISGTSTDDMWAVGGSYRNLGGGWSVPTATGFHWEGAAWTQVDVPTPRSMSFLASIDVTSDGTGFAVGGSDRATLHHNAPLIAQACGL